MPIHENKLEVVAYDSHWPAAFEVEAIRLRAALGSLAGYPEEFLQAGVLPNKALEPAAH